MKEKLPVFATVGRAFASVFSTRILLSGFFLKCFLAYMLYAELYHIISILFNIPKDSLAASFIFGLPSPFILAPFFIGIHRLVILGYGFPTNPFKGFFGTRNINFAIYGILFFLPIEILTFVMQQVLKYELIGWFGLLMLFEISYCIILLRVFIYFPAIAIDDRQTLSTCWRLTRKSTWRFFWLGMIYLIILLTPIFSLAYMLGLDKIVALTSYTQEVFSSVRRFLDMQYFVLMINLFGFVLAAVFVAIISHAFIFFHKREKSWV